jgi:ferrous iron transport protein B
MMHNWLNLKGFLFRAGKFIIIASIILAFLNSFGTNGRFGNEGTEKSVLTKIGRTITPAFTPFGVEEENWPASVALFTGLFAKESVVGTMNALYGQMGEARDSSDGQPDETAPSGAPDRREGGRRESSFLIMRGYFSNSPARAYAYLLFVLLYFPCIATLFFQFTVGKNPLWIGVSPGDGAAIILILALIGRILQKVESRRLSAE